MHLRAIDIKVKLLGENDYEVALSVGHLASLYNYDMYLYEKAEQLYFRSIKIGDFSSSSSKNMKQQLQCTYQFFAGRSLFGETYSGLEYDYRGLRHLYDNTDQYERALEMHETIQRWLQLRSKSMADQMQPFDLEPDENISSTLQNFFKIST